MAFQLYPSFNFNESNVGPRPVRAASVDRIGLVGMFNRGPLAPMICDAESAKLIYGFTNDVGSAHLQAMIDQGANSFLINRVLGAADTALLNTTIVGTAATGSGTLDIDIKSGATTVTTQVALTVGMTGSTIATAVVAAVNLLVGNTYVTAVAGSGNTGTTGQVNYTAKSSGAAGNSIQVKYTLTTTTGLTFGPGSIGSAFVNLAGGADGPLFSAATIATSAPATLITLTSIWPGASANSITGTIAAGSDTGLYTITLEYAAEGIKEVYRDIDMTDLYDENKLSVFRGSLLVRGALVATGTPVLGAITFSGGLDGATIVTEDFTAAIDALKDYSCTILTCPGIKPNGVDQKAIQAAMTSQAEAIDTDMGEQIGLRLAIGSLPQGTKTSDIATLKAANWIPNSKRTVIMVGWATYSKLQKFKRFGIDPAALYAAHLMVTPVHVSPAARSSSPFITSITEVDTPVGQAAQNEITKNKLDAIVVDPTTGGFHCLNGRSTSSDAAWYWICYRRVYDKVRTDIFFGFQFSKSEPSNSSLDAVVEGTANNYLQGLLYDGIINGFDPAVSNDANNPPAIRDVGKRYVDLGLEMVPPNDFTQFNLNRVVRGSVRLA